MATLAAITVAQFFAYQTASGNTSGEFGRWTFDTLTAAISALPSELDPFEIKFNEATGLLTDLGKDPNALSDLDYALVFEAMAGAVGCELLLRDSSGFTLPAEQFKAMREDYRERIRFHWNRAGVAWKALGLADGENPYLNPAAVTPTVSVVSPPDGRPIYPYNYFSIYG